MNTQIPNILHVITRLDRGGSATNTITCADALRKHGFTTAILYGRTRDPDNSIRERLENLRIRHVSLRNLLRNPSPLNDLVALLQMRSLMRQGTFDIVHTHSSKAGVLGRIAAHSAGIPAVHTPHGHVFYGYFGRVLTNVFVLAERRMARVTERIVSLTDAETRESLQHDIGTPEQYVTIPSGVRISSFRSPDSETGREFRKRHNIPVHAVLFVSIGRLVPVKGFDILLEAFKQAEFGGQEVLLAIVGDGPEQQKLKRLAASPAISGRVRFVEPMSDVRPALSAADIFALASRNEGMGRAFVEAMASGLPVIGAAVGGVPSLIEDGKNGLLVEAGNRRVMARAMEALALKPDLRLEMGKKAGDSVYPEYDEETMVTRLASLYREVLRNAGGYSRVS
ncbi:MAG: glycosyltransferase family 4 protein [Kiritimatiellia bacterium]